MREPLFPGAKVDKEVTAVLEQTGRQLEDMGHRVDYDTPKIDSDRMWRDFFTVVCAHTAYLVEDLELRYGKQQVANLEPQTRNMAMIGRSLSVMDLLKAKQGWHEVQYQTGLILEQYDMILCPTVPTAAVKHGVLPPGRIDELLLNVSGLIEKGINIGKWIYNSSIVERLSAPVLSKMAFTTLGNITGLPAMSVPLGMTSQGLPIGMQFIGRMNDEARLFALAAQFESAGLFTDPAI